MKAVPSNSIKQVEEATVDGVEAWQTIDAQLARRAMLGLNQQPTAQMLREYEFISLGSFCGVSSALQALGIKSASYPFDWCRTPVDGLIHLYNSGFADFLTFTGSEMIAGFKVFKNTGWGGSFWHHDLDDKEVRRGLLRRTERLLGYGDVPLTKNRFFVRSANSSREVLQTLQLRDVLRDAYPDASVRLLLLVEGQKQKTAWRIEGDFTDLLMVNVPTVQYAPGISWTMKVHAEAYADAIGFGLHYFANAPHALNSVNTVKDLPSYMDTLAKWDGGNCSNQTLKVEPVIGFNFVTQLARRGAQTAE